MTSLKDGLKRVKSEYNLAAAVSAANRESSSSLSPVKQDFESSALKRSTSRFDLKKQQKLSKRVSDLEAKLSTARRELDEALIEATPNPKLNNKYERFTPQSTLKRPRFVPGQLPSLPSERILMAEQLGFGDDEASPEKLPSEGEPRKGLDLSEVMDLDGDDTIRPYGARGRSYPPRADSLFKLSNGNIDHSPEVNTSTDPNSNGDTVPPHTTHTSMDPNSANPFVDSIAAPTATGGYAALDAKLKALDDKHENEEAAMAAEVPIKATKTKKRKSGANNRDDVWRPGKETEDDDDYPETPRKKRKSGIGPASSPNTKRTGGGPAQSGSPAGKKATDGTAKKARGRPKKQAAPAIVPETMQYSEDEVSDAAQGADELNEAPARSSLDSQGVPLEPVFEEEEETLFVPLNGDPVKPSAKATPVRFGRLGGRSRSGSPHKRGGSVQPGAEETMITRAAEAAQGRRAADDEETSIDGTAMTVTDTEKSVVADGSKVTTRKRKLQLHGGEKDDYEWPEDVF
jgi:hypothetical protein